MTPSNFKLKGNNKKMKQGRQRGPGLNAINAVEIQQIKVEYDEKELSVQMSSKTSKRSKFTAHFCKRA